MKIIRVLSGIVLCAFLCSCKERHQTVTYHDEEKTQMKEKISGYFRQSNGETEVVLDGYYRTWYLSGVMETEAYFSDDKPVGYATVWWPNGEIRVKNHCNSNGLLDGEQLVFDNEGNLLKRYHMANGTGIEYHFHDNGSLKSEINWVNGQLDGILKRFDEDGKLLSSQVYSQGKPVPPVE